VQEQFAEKFPETPVTHRNAVRRLTVKFRETGSMLMQNEVEGHLNLTIRSSVDFSDSMLRSPSKSLRKLAQEKDIGLATAIPAYIRNISQ
jgi:hypothetical protein